MEAGIQQESERENESSIPIIEKKSKIILFRFSFSTKSHRTITKVIDNIGLVEENYFEFSSSLKNHPPSYAASHLL